MTKPDFFGVSQRPIAERLKGPRPLLGLLLVPMHHQDESSVSGFREDGGDTCCAVQFSSRKLYCNIEAYRRLVQSAGGLERLLPLLDDDDRAVDAPPCDAEGAPACMHPAPPTHSLRNPVLDVGCISQVRRNVAEHESRVRVHGLCQARLSTCERMNRETSRESAPAGGCCRSR